MKTENSYPGFEAMKQQERAAYLLAGYIRNDLTAEEEEELDKWITSSDDNMKLFEELTDEDRMEEYLRWYQTTDVETRLEQTRAKLFPERRPVIRAVWKYAAAAAILITTGIMVYLWKPTAVIEKPPVTQIPPGQATGEGLPVLKLNDGRIIQLTGIKDTVINEQVSIINGAVVYNSKTETTAAWHELIIPRKTMYQLILPDGTKVLLNAASSIKYPSSFNDATREVTVTGETYFQVAKNTAKPFVAIVNNIRVQATGTAFNINAYPGVPYIGITLAEGSVKVSSDRKTRELRIDQQLQIRNLENWKIESADTDAALAWTKSKLRLNNTGLNELKHSLERWYDITVVIQTKEDKHLNGTFPREISLPTLLQLLENTNDVHFKMDGNRLTVLN